MIAWVAWFFVAPWLFVLDGVVAAWLPYRPDLGIALCLVFAADVRPRALPGALLCAAVGRSLLHVGDAALHFLAFGVPVAVLLPLRIVFFRRSVAWQAASAAFLAITVPKAGAFFAGISGQVAVPADVTVASVLVAMVGVPVVAWLLRSIPPLSSFVQRAE
jgi:hypothetical protein